MECSHCGRLLPDGSAYCPYCGISLSPQVQEGSFSRRLPQAQEGEPDAWPTGNISATQSAMYMPVAKLQEPKGAKRGKRAKSREAKCAHCGHVISKKDKICPICGTSISRNLRLRPALIAMSIAVCLLLCSTAYFMLEMFQGNQAIVRLKEENRSLLGQVDDYQSQSNYWKTRAQEWSQQYDMLKYKVDFYDACVVFVGNSNQYYHSYDCYDLDLSYFYAFNSENAEVQGYRPCPYCQ